MICDQNPLSFPIQLLSGASFDFLFAQSQKKTGRYLTKKDCLLSSFESATGVLDVMIAAQSQKVGRLSWISAGSNLTK